LKDFGQIVPSAPAYTVWKVLRLFTSNLMKKYEIIEDEIMKINEVEGK
jgi:hypothetical protein